MFKKNLKYCIFSLVFSTMLMFSAGTIRAEAEENQEQSQMEEEASSIDKKSNNSSDVAAPASNDSISSTPAEDGSGDTTPAEDGSGDTTPAEDASGDTTPAEDGSDDTAPAEDGSDDTAPAEEGSDDTAPAEEGSDDTAPAEEEEAAEETEEPLFQDVFVNFIDNANDKLSVRSHVDSRTAEQEKVNYYIVGTTSSTTGNEYVYNYTKAYLTLAKWELKDKNEIGRAHV